VTNSIALYGKDQEVEYECIYAGYKYVFVESDQVGCALVTVPAVYLAQNVLPEGMDASSLHGLPLVEWEKKLDLNSLSWNSSRGLFKKQVTKIHGFIDTFGG
jgi:histidine decarboxylase